MSYRDDVTALAARTEALAKDVADRTRELDDARQLLDEAQARAKRPVLDNIRVASPCTAAWDQMTGDDRVRHCHQCKLDVYNLSAMTRDEAEGLVASRNGRLCVRYFQRTDGTIILADCVIGKSKKRKRALIAAGAAALLAGGAGAAYALTRPTEETEPEIVMGDAPSPDPMYMAQVAHDSPAPPPQVVAPQPPPPEPIMGKVGPTMGDVIFDDHE